MDLYCHYVCPGSYLKYAFSIYKAKYDDQIGESPWWSWCYLICIITHRLKGLRKVARAYYQPTKSLPQHAAARLAEPISLTAWWIFSIRSSMKFSRLVVVYCHGHLPICPIWACHGLKTCQICHKLGPDFVEHISLLDELTPFKVSWTFLDL